MRQLNVARYRKTLLAERERVHKEIEDLGEEIGYSESGPGQSELADYDNHPADDGTDTFLKGRDLAVRDSRRDILGRIDDALGKIKRGTYGVCDRCGSEISKERLDAIPYAIYCVHCQDVIEGR